ncbi:MAG TPA: suppressor of fused domain protein [Jatrophihabitans sp.]|nr:suppressor of fused domain protein [Jatrophihabitans sp.]
MTALGLGDPQHFGTNHLPDQDGAYGLNAYRTTDGWLMLTLGLSELFGKVSDDPAVSGWGFELTMRVVDGSQPDAPPQWALKLLLKLSQYVYQQGRPFAPGHRMSPGGPITGSPDTRLTALAFATDPQLPGISTPNGSVQFLTVVGITTDELATMQATSTDHVLSDLRAHYSTLATDITR